LPGERLSLTVAKPGREAGQGLAYLEDGTMVVIEDAAELVGRTVEVQVTSSLQTNMGRMIFARPNERAATAPSRRDAARMRTRPTLDASAGGAYAACGPVRWPVRFAGP
jgi:hypothetical protein